MAIVKEKGVLHVNGITASQILDLIYKHHNDDVVVAECKNGPTYTTRALLKLDAWVLKRTYSPLTTIGYEIKVARSDFERDQKWVEYMDYCHQFYFVYPAGLIRSVDIPKEVGLFWTTLNGQGLRLKKHAERHEPDTEKLNRLFTYVLMSRTKIVSDMNEANKADTPEYDRVQHMKDYLKECEEKKELAYMIKGHFRQFYDETVKKDRSLQYREDNIKRFEAKLAKLGIIWDSKSGNWYDNQQVENQIDALKKQIPEYLLMEMENTGQKLINVVDKLRKATD